MNRYITKRILKSNDASQVCIAKHSVLGCERLIKRISKDSEAYKSLSYEAFLMKDFNHLRIPKIYDLYEDEQYLYIVEEYISGEVFSSFCKNKIFETEEIIDFAVQVCSIIEYLHSLNPPVLYLDLKPDNLIYTENGLYLVDFGSCVRSTGITAECNYGTIGYAAPEQLFNKTADERADIYAIGMLLLYMASGGAEKLLLENTDFIMKNGRELKKIAGRCLKKNAAFRFQSVTDLKEHLEKLKFSCRKSITKKLNAESIKIKVTSSSKGRGATYTSLMLARYFIKKRKSVIVVQISKNGLVQAAVEQRLEPVNGIFNIYGVEVINCTEKINKEVFAEELKNKDIIIADTEPADNSELLSDMFLDTKDTIFDSPDYVIAVCGARQWEYSSLRQCMRKYLKEKECETIFAFNFISPDDYYECIGGFKGIKTFRLPVVFNIFGSEFNKIYEIFDDIFVGIEVKKGESS